MPRGPQRVSPNGLLNRRASDQVPTTKLTETDSFEMPQLVSPSQGQREPESFGGSLPSGANAENFDISSWPHSASHTHPDSFDPSLPGHSDREDCFPRGPHSGLMAAAARAGLSRGAVEAHLNKRLGKSGKERLLHAVRLNYKNHAGDSSIRGLGIPREQHLPFLPIVDLWLLAENLNLADPVAMAFNISFDSYGMGGKCAPESMCSIAPGSSFPSSFCLGAMGAASQYTQIDLRPECRLVDQESHQPPQEPSRLHEQGQNQFHGELDMQVQHQTASYGGWWRQQHTLRGHQQLPWFWTQQEQLANKAVDHQLGGNEEMPQEQQHWLHGHAQLHSGDLRGQSQQPDCVSMTHSGLQQDQHVRCRRCFGVGHPQLQPELQQPPPQHQSRGCEHQRVPHEWQQAGTVVPLFHQAAPPNSVLQGSESNTWSASACFINQILLPSECPAGAAEARACAGHSVLTQLSCKSDDDESDEEWQPWATPHIRGVEPRLFGTDPAWHCAH